MKIKKILAFLAATVITTNIIAVTSAAHNVTDCGLSHTVSTTYWDLYENSVHWSNYATKMAVNCGDFKGTGFETYIEKAVKTWDSILFNGSDLMSIETDDTNGCVVFKNKTANQMNVKFGYTAWAVTNRSDAKIADTKLHHYSTAAGSVEIWVDWNTVSGKSDRSKTHVPLHELGHVIGLVDIPKSVSVNSYLMCNDFGSTAPITITNADAKGAAVILGQHTHTVKSIPFVKYNDTYCKRTCSICKAYNYYKHTFSNNVCKWCGYKKTTTTSVGDYENYNMQVNEAIGDEVEPVPVDENEVLGVFDENVISYDYDMPFEPAEIK